MKLSEELAWRGFTNQTTYENPEAIDKSPITFYFGVDPSANSMQIGNLASAMMVRHFIDHGHKAVLLVGGATGLIGDPDGKKQERDLKSLDEIDKYKAAIAEQYRIIFSGQDFEIVDNYDWFKDIGYMDFLRDVGKHVPMRQMLGRDFVQTRLKEDGTGISYAEFSYVLIQAYDFLHLNKTKSVTLQICGSDQWGNSIAGVDLIRRVEGKEAHVWSAPLVINKSTGVKFGKSEDGAVWLDADLTPPYSFYQFWLNVDDEGVGDYLKIYTLISPNEYDSLIKEFEADRSSRAAQKYLAYEVTKLIHGQETADSVKRITEVLFGGGEYSKLKESDFATLKAMLPVASLKPGDTLTAALVGTGLSASNSEARRFLQQNAVYLNGEQVDESRTISSSDRLDGRHAIIRRGKNKNAILQISE